MALSDWFQCARPRPAARVRLFAFPFGGGGASTFFSWDDLLPPSVELHAAKLPGRETRLREPPIDDMSTLVAALADALRGNDARPFAFFGHSMGALVSYALTRQLIDAGRPLPERLFVSARPAPQLTLTRPLLHTMPSDQLLRALQSYGGIPAPVLREPELVALILPILRADMTLLERYVHRDGPPLAIPLSVYGGDADPHVSREELDAWAAVTSSGCAVEVFRGDHFYLNQPSLRAALVGSIGRALSRTPS